MFDTCEALTRRHLYRHARWTQMGKLKQRKRQPQPVEEQRDALTNEALDKVTGGLGQLKSMGTLNGTMTTSGGTTTSSST
jgi:hypothetical protein